MSTHDLTGASLPPGYLRNDPAGQRAGINQAQTPRDKTKAEVILDRLTATAQHMATHNDVAGISLDRLVGGVRAGQVGGEPPAQPMPAEFVGQATALLDRIGAELERMESNAARLSALG